MAHYTTTREFGPFSVHHLPESLSVYANGGTVTLEVKVSSTVWITQKTYSADASEMAEVAGKTIRITPAAGAEYNFGSGV